MDQLKLKEVKEHFHELMKGASDQFVDDLSVIALTFPKDERVRGFVDAVVSEISFFNKKNTKFACAIILGGKVLERDQKRRKFQNYGAMCKRLLD